MRLNMSKLFSIKGTIGTGILGMNIFALDNKPAHALFARRRRQDWTRPRGNNQDQGRNPYGHSQATDPAAH
jgi:hypothetical protein